MNGHWLSTTRKLNKHYQSGSRAIPAPLWGEIALIGLCGHMDYYDRPLVLDKDGVWWSDSVGQKGFFQLPYLDITNYAYSIFPIGWVCTNGISINGYAIPDLSNYTLTDQSGTIKFKKTIITVEYDIGGGSLLKNEEVYLLYIDFSDLPKQTIGSSVFTRPTGYYDVKWNLPFRIPEATPVTVRCVRNNLNLSYSDGSVYKFDGLGAIDYSITVFYDGTSTYAYNTPSNIGSYVNTNVNMFLDSINNIDAYLYDVSGGVSGLELEPLSGNSLTCYMAQSRGYDYQLNNAIAVYTRVTSFRSRGGTRGVILRVFSNEFDVSYLYGGSGSVISGTGSYNRSEVVGWQ